MTESDASDWPSYLLAAMKAAGYTRQADLSRDTGIGDAVISKWLGGVTQPSIPQLRRLSAALRLPVLQLAVAAGHFTAKEAQLKDVKLPAPQDIGDDIEREIKAAGYPPEVEKMLLKQRQDNAEQVRDTIAALRAAGVLRTTKGDRP